MEYNVSPSVYWKMHNEISIKIVIKQQQSLTKWFRLVLVSESSAALTENQGLSRVKYSLIGVKYLFVWPGIDYLGDFINTSR